MLKINAIILSGGRGQRLQHKEKGLLIFQGEELIKRKLRSLKDIVKDIYIVTNQPGLYKELGNKAKIITDQLSYGGPLQAIYSVLSSSTEDINFITAVDMPFLNIKLLEFLYSFADKYDIVVIKKEKIEPLFGFYSKKVSPFLENLVSENNKGPTALVELVSTKYISAAEARIYDPQLLSLENINEEADLKRLELVTGPLNI